MCCALHSSTRFKHTSSSLGCDMTFTIFFPEGAEEASSSGQKFPVLYYLSGLTCTDENVTQKGGAQKACAKHGIAFVAPDTSPRCVKKEQQGVGVGLRGRNAVLMRCCEPGWQQSMLCSGSKSSRLLLEFW